MTQEFPASFAQQRLWLATQLAPDVGVYNIGFLLTPQESAPDADRLRAALQVMVDRHETLRTALAMRDGALVQVVHRSLAATFETSDLGTLDEPAAASAAEALLARDSARPFDLERAPLWRGRMITWTDPVHGPRWDFAFVVHHTVFDARSAVNFIRELRVLDAGGSPAGLPELPIQYADFAAWQRDQVDGGALDAQFAYWRRRLADLPPEIGLPTDRPRPPRPSHRGGDVLFDVPVHGAVASLAREAGAPPYAVLLAAFVALLHRLSGQTDVVVGSPVAGRSLPELAPLLGMFVNSLVLRVDASGDPSFRSLLRRSADAVLESLDHPDVPFDKLVLELDADRDPSRPPLYQVVLNLMPSTGAAQAGNGTAKVDLILDLYETEHGTLGGRLEYASDLFDEPTARAMASRFAQLLTAALAAPDTPLSRLPLLLPGERIPVNRAPLNPSPVLVRFDRQVQERPSAVAVRCGDASLTYAELAERSHSLAARLTSLGAGPERPVALLLDPGIDLAVAVLATLRAEAPYLPLDTDHPPSRLRTLLADADAVAVIASAPVDVPVPVLPATWASPTAQDTPRDAHVASLAYVIYTSGSTGRPKGVGITHGNLAAYVEGLVRLVEPAPGAVWTLLQPLTFDFGVTTFYGALLTGGTLDIVPRDQATDAAAVVDHLRRAGTDYLKVTPSHLAALRSAGELAPRRALILGGEASDWDFFRSLPGDVINHYGPTETTVGVLALPPMRTWAHVAPVPVGGMTPIGVAMAHAEAHVLDARGEPVPDGVVGELCVGGDTVARGYLGLPGLTADRFVPDAFSGRPGARLYRTGDLVRRRRDGVIEFVGRADDQVKIRGFRVEPGEVRQLLLAHPTVADCAVIALDAGTPEARLAAFVVPTPEFEVATLKEHAERELPAYLVPSSITVLDELPLTPHGKLDRAALPTPADAEEEPTYEAPSGEYEEIVAGLFGLLLKRDRIGRRDNFFALGGHSLLGIQLMTRLRKAFGTALPLKAMFEDPTVAGLAARLGVRLAGAELPAIEPVPRDRPLPASYGQQRLWFLDQLEPDAPLYNTHFTLRLNGPLDVARLRNALVEIVRRHEVLRTRFAGSANGLVQLVDRRPELPFVVQDGDADRWAQLTAFGSGRFDLVNEPPVRALLVRHAAERHELMLTMHHTVFDGSSVAVLVTELAALYRGDDLPPLAIQYGDFAAWQRSVVTGPLRDTQLAHWRRTLAGAPPRLELPTDRPRPRRVGAGGEHQLFDVPSTVAERLRELGAGEGATLFMTLLAGYLVLLRRYTGQHDLVVGVPLVNRPRPEVEPLIGFFVNTLVLRVDTAGDPTFRELVTRTRAATVEAYANADVPFEALVEELAPDRDQGVTPIVQTMFMLADDQRALDVPLGDGVSAAFEPFALGHAKFDVSMFLWRRADGLTGAIEYRPDLFDDATIRAFTTHFAALLTVAAASPDAPLSALSTERGRHPFRDKERVPPTFRTTAVDAIAEQVAMSPDAVAVRDGERMITYRELWDLAGGVATRLNVARGAVVGVCLPRSAELVAAVLGVMRAGAAYLPLDPDYPAARLSYVLAEAEALITDTLPFDGPTLRIADVEPAQYDGAPTPDDRAYVLYTSGSTGEPKGVVVGHEALANQLNWVRAELGLTADDRVAQRTPVGFDASVWELFAPLTAGVSIVITPSSDLAAMAELVRANEITVLQLVPTLLAAIDLADCPSLRIVASGGEALPQALADRVMAGTGARLVNLYGPTECCVQATFATAVPGATRPTVPIGEPVPGVTAYVLDDGGAPVPDGVPGELHLGGVQVAHGYHRRAALTADRFVPDPFAGTPGARLYRTGDRVRRTPDGLEFLGRLDDQVKVRGVRVELGEIRAALAACDGVTDTAVILRDGLVGYVVGPPLDSGRALRTRLRERLPDSMVPTAVVVLDALPRLPNGKLDAAALPSPEQASTVAHVEPGTPVERLLCDLFAELLRRERVGVHDDFFALGGHSLLMATLVARIRDELGVDLPLRRCFDAPTVAELAVAVVTEQLGGSDLDALLAELELQPANEETS